MRPGTLGETTNRKAGRGEGLQAGKNDWPVVIRVNFGSVQATLPFRGGLIRFEPNTTQLTASSSAPLEQVLSELLRDRDRAILVKAFADAREHDLLRLSTERAESVAEWLIARGISPGRVESRGCGAKRPLWADDTADHEAANRRGEVVTKTSAADCEPPRSFDRFGEAAR